MQKGELHKQKDKHHMLKESAVCHNEIVLTQKGMELLQQELTLMLNEMQTLHIHMYKNLM